MACGDDRRQGRGRLMVDQKRTPSTDTADGARNGSVYKNNHTLPSPNFQEEIYPLMEQKSNFYFDEWERTQAQRRTQAPEPAPPPEKPRFTLLSAAEIASQGPMEWKLKGLIPWLGVGQIYGPSMSGKSFLALDLAAHIAEGKAWFGYRVKRSPVIYLCLEGSEGFKKRIQAYGSWHKRSMPPDLKFIIEPFSILTDAVRLAEAIPKGALVIIDTQNASAPFIDENSARDMGAVVEAAKTIARAIEGFSLLIAHCGKNTTNGPRGSSVQIPAWDSCFEVKRNGESRSWKVVKSKDGADNQEHNFALELVHLGEDADGDMITSCVAVPAEGTRQKEELTKNQAFALQSFRDGLAKNLSDTLTLEEWRTVFYAGHWGENGDTKKKAFSRGREDLVSRGLVSVTNDIYSLI